jgi:methionine synthase II (cobalamin-independent)
MFATFAGGYSRKPNPGLPDVLGEAEPRVRDGSLDEAGYRAVADDFVREIVKEQEIIGLAIVGEGGVRAPDRTQPLIDGLEGVTRGEPTTLPDGEPATRPVVGDRGPGGIRWVRPISVRDWEFADEVSETLVKQTFVGPYSLASLAEPIDAARRAKVALAFAEALHQELAALAAAGCPIIEVDEPFALQIGDRLAEWRAFREANERLTAGIGDAEDAPHLSLGLWGGEIDADGHDDLLALPYVSYLVDVLPGPSAWRFIRNTPPDRGVIVGSADKTTEYLEDQEVHVWAMTWAARGDRGPARVGCAPNGALFGIKRHFAHRKCLRLGEAVRIAAWGPMEDVAEAVDENPLRSKIPELRQMAEAVEAAQRG